MNSWTIVIPAVTGVGFTAWAGLYPRSQLFGSTVCNAGKACALTFDDGPNPRVTPALLKLLEKHGVPATFFVLGKYVQQYPELARDVVAADHAIGNHTYGHPNLLLSQRGRIIDELRRCEDTIFSATGKRSSCIRPPFGFRGPQFFSAAREMGLSRIIMWSISVRDWNPQPAANLIHRLRKVQSGDILLLHDGDHRTSGADRFHVLRALEHWLPRWKDSGLQFVKTDPMLQS
jgi:peptidoglycan/xylan/chitin deacetylase (PgdA/CDA1 family)